jgi:hypothetical protein
VIRDGKRKYKNRREFLVKDTGISYGRWVDIYVRGEIFFIFVVPVCLHTL